MTPAEELAGSKIKAQENGSKLSSLRTKYRGTVHESVIKNIMDKEEDMSSTVQPIRGWLSKQGHSTFGKGWKRRYFVLTVFADSPTIYYYKKEVTGDVSMSREKPVGCIKLPMTSAALVPSDDATYEFTATSASASSSRDKGGVVYPLRAESEEERQFWIESCNNAMLQLQELCAMRRIARETVSTDGNSSHDLADLDMAKSGECVLM